MKDVLNEQSMLEMKDEASREEPNLIISLINTVRDVGQAKSVAHAVGVPAECWEDAVWWARTVG